MKGVVLLAEAMTGIPLAGATNTNEAALIDEAGTESTLFLPARIRPIHAPE